MKTLVDANGKLINPLIVPELVNVIVPDVARERSSALPFVIALAARVAPTLLVILSVLRPLAAARVVIVARVLGLTMLIVPELLMVVVVVVAAIVICTALIVVLGAFRLPVFVTVNESPKDNLSVPPVPAKLVTDVLIV